MFKAGDRVVCVDTYGSSYLTMNSVYVIEEISAAIAPDFSDYIIKIKNDTGGGNDYFKSRFISLSEYRKQKLEKLCLKKEI